MAREWLNSATSGHSRRTPKQSLDFGDEFPAIRTKCRMALSAIAPTQSTESCPASRTAVRLQAPTNKPETWILVHPLRHQHPRPHECGRWTCSSLQALQVVKLRLPRVSGTAHCPGNICQADPRRPEGPGLRGRDRCFCLGVSHRCAGRDADVRAGAVDVVFCSAFRGARQRELEAAGEIGPGFVDLVVIGLAFELGGACCALGDGIPVSEGSIGRAWLLATAGGTPATQRARC